MTRLTLALCVFLVSSGNAASGPRRKRVLKVYPRDEIGDLIGRGHGSSDAQGLAGGRSLQKNKDVDMASDQGAFREELALLSNPFDLVL